MYKVRYCKCLWLQAVCRSFKIITLYARAWQPHKLNLLSLAFEATRKNLKNPSLHKAMLFIECLVQEYWARYISRYSDWLRDGRSWGSNPGGSEIFRVWGPTQPHVQWVPGLSRG
jgi:hypothetical protein